MTMNVLLLVLMALIPAALVVVVIRNLRQTFWDMKRERAGWRDWVLVLTIAATMLFGSLIGVAPFDIPLKSILHPKAIDMHAPKVGTKATDGDPIDIKLPVPPAGQECQPGTHECR